MAGKGDGRRPGKGYQDNHARIFGERPKRAPYTPPPVSCEHSGPTYAREDDDVAIVRCCECHAPRTWLKFWPY